ncbi:MAG TPA: hypothetical protein VGR16_15045, partial [Thermomicrobiales bacterium]|nr:hypothetical protein [Thermomicrobiales bacterium]
MSSETPRPVPVAGIDRDLKRLKWWTILAPVLFLMLLEAARRILGPGFDESWPGYVLLAGVVAIGALAFSEVVFGVIAPLEDRTIQQ